MTTTLNVLTKYELAVLISERAEDIANGSPVTIETTIDNPIEIAMEELRQNKIPKKIVRKFPNGSKEIISVNKLRKF